MRTFTAGAFSLFFLASCGSGSGRTGGQSASGGGTAATTLGGTGTSAGTSGGATGTGGPGSATAGSASGSAGDGGQTSGVKFDVDSTLDLGNGGCNGGGGGMNEQFSYIWIANSSQGTVSKINTKTGVEEGRYYTHPSQGQGNPSRTSVNLLGDVAVSNRTPGMVTKIAADPSRCVDKNNNNMIDTSTGPADIRPWGQDECVLWSLEIPSLDYNHGPRPTAWEGGKFNEDTCTVDQNPRLWVGYRSDAGNGVFLRIDGATGQILDTVQGPAWQGISAMGPYGGAVNANGDFIVTGLNYGNSIHIDADTLQVTELPGTPQDKYGMGLDANGNIWVGGFQGNVWHYDFQTDTWTSLQNTGGTRVNGIMVDRKGVAWGAGSSPCRLVKIDVATKTILNNNIPLPGCSSPWGISIDVDGYVWVVDMGAAKAFKVHPDTHQVELEVTGLVGPYTYSDMTGAGLNLVVNPPG